MEGTPIDIVAFAPLAPLLGVLLFWFIQLLFIESQKFLLEKIRPKHEPLCRFTNFLGILFQTICHALGYTITKSGISDFYISISYGKVAPKKEKKGVFEWISNVFLFVGPFFIPSFLLLICLIFLIPQGFNVTTPAHLIDLKYTFGGMLTTFGTSLYSFTVNFLNFLLNLDLLNPIHLGFLFLMLFLGLGIRPTHIGEQKKDKVDMIYDLRNIWSLIRHHPLYILMLFLICYLFYYISFYLNRNWYIWLFAVFGWLSIIAIISIIITHFLIIFIYITDKIKGKKRIIPYISLPLSYILARIIFYYFPSDYVYIVSLIVMMALTFLITLLLLRRKGDRFKSKRNIKRKKKKRKGEKDG